jgi:hypothetical protein
MQRLILILALLIVCGCEKDIKEVKAPTGDAVAMQK